MHEYPILGDLLIVFAVAGVVVYGLQRVKVPSIVGLLVAGAIVGPHGLGLVHEEEEVELLAELGVVVLLFTVGLEFSLSRLMGQWREMVWVGLPQVLICLVGVGLLAWPLVGAIRPAIFVGMLVAMSSTAVVLKVLTDRGELGTPHGRLSISVLLLQDLLVTVFILSLPLLRPVGAGPEGEGAGADGLGMAWEVVRGALVVVLVLAGSRMVVPRLLERVVGTRNRELFVLFLVMVCLGTAQLTAWAGLSLALGAFLAGLALSESDYAHQAFSEVLPFRDTLSSLFFVSVGMLFDVRFVASHPVLVGGSVVAVLVVKFLAGAAPTLLFGYPPRVAVLVGVALAQIGEFSFVLANKGASLGIVGPQTYQAVISAAVLSMLATPFLVSWSPRLANRLSNVAGPRLGQTKSGGGTRSEFDPTKLEDHVIIVGYGLCGRNLARVLLSVEIPYVILEMNPESVRRLHGQGEPIVYGDATRPAVLRHLGIRRARLLVMAISDPAATRRAVQLARQLNARLHIVSRTEYVSEVEELKRLGADEIVPEDFVTSVELFARVLREYKVPRNQILDLIDRVRSDQYEALRGLRPAKLNLLFSEIASEVEVDSCQVTSESPAVGKTLAELDLRAKTGATLLAVRREGHLQPNPDAGFRLEPGDVAILFGSREQIDAASLGIDPALGRAAAGRP